MSRVLVGDISPESGVLLQSYLSIYMPDAEVEPLRSMGIKGKMKTQAKKPEVALVILDEMLYATCVGVCDDVLSLPKVHKYIDDDGFKEFMISKFGKLDNTPSTNSIPPDVLLSQEKEDEDFGDPSSIAVVNSSEEELSKQSEELERLKDKLSQSEMLVRNLTAQLEEANDNNDLSDFVKRIKELESQLEEKSKEEETGGTSPEVEEKLAQAEKVIQDFEKTKEELKTAKEDFADLQFKKSQLEEELNTTKETFYNLRDKVTALEEEKNKLEYKLIERDSAYDDLYCTLNTTSSELASANSELELLKQSSEGQSKVITQLEIAKQELSEKTLEYNNLVVDFEKKQKEMGGLQEKLNDVLADLEAKTIELNSCNDRVQLLDDACKESDKSIEDLTAKVSKLEKELSSKQEEINVLSENTSSESKGYLEKIDELTSEVSDLQEQIKGYSTEVADLQAQVEELQSESEEYLKKDEEHSAEVSQLQSQIGEYETEIAELQNQVKNYSENDEERSAKVSKLQSQIDDYETKVSDLQEQIKGYSEKDEEHLAEVSKLQSQIGEYETDIADLNKQIKEYTEKIEALQSQDEGHTTEVSDLQEQIKGYSEQIKSLNETLVLKTDELEVKEKALNDLVEEKLSLEERYDNLATEKDELRGSLTALESEKSDLETKVSELNEKISVNESELNVVRSTLVEKDNLLEERDNQISELEVQNGKLENKVSSLQESLDSNKDDKSTIENLENDLLEEKRKSTRLASELDSLKKTSNSGRTAELREEISSLKAENEQLKKSGVESLNKELSKYKSKVESLESDLAEQVDLVNELNDSVFFKMAYIASPKLACDINLEVPLNLMDKRCYCLVGGSSESNLLTYQLIKKTVKANPNTRFLVVDLVTDSCIDRELGVQKVTSPINWLNGSSSFKDFLATTKYNNVKCLSTGLAFINDLYLLQVDWQKRISEVQGFGDVVIFNIGCLNSTITKILYNTFSSIMKTNIIVKATPINLRTLILSLTGLKKSENATAVCVGYDDTLSKPMYSRLSSKYKSLILKDTDVLKL